MSLTYSVILSKLTLGVGLAAPVGPVTIAMLQRGLQQGFWAAYSIRIGGVFGNGLCLLMTLFAMNWLEDHHGALYCLSLLGAGLLGWYGYKAIRHTVNTGHLLNHPDQQTTNQTNPSLSARLINGIMTGFWLGVANPVSLVFWIGLFAANTVDTHPLDNLLILAGVLLWGLGLATILAFAKHLVSERGLKLVSLLSGVLLMGFSVHYAIKSVKMIVVG